MHTLARCPICESTFQVSETQLTARNGLVRCGKCFGVFNATENLIDAAQANSFASNDIMNIKPSDSTTTRVASSDLPPLNAAAQSDNHTMLDLPISDAPAPTTSHKLSFPNSSLANIDLSQPNLIVLDSTRTQAQVAQPSSVELGALDQLDEHLEVLFEPKTLTQAAVTIASEDIYNASIASAKIKLPGALTESIKSSVVNRELTALNEFHAENSDVAANVVDDGNWLNDLIQEADKHKATTHKQSATTAEIPTENNISSEQVLRYLRNSASFSQKQSPAAEDDGQINLSPRAQAMLDQHQRKMQMSANPISYVYSLGWAAAVVLMIASFMMQMIYFNPLVLERYPPLQKITNSACLMLSCSGSFLSHDVSAVKIEDITTTASSTKGAIIRFILVNNSVHDLFPPNLELNVIDSRGQHTKKLISPEQYLPTPLNFKQKIEGLERINVQLDVNSFNPRLEELVIEPTFSSNS